MQGRIIAGLSANRRLLAGAAALMASVLAHPMGSIAPAEAATVELWHRPGGYTHAHIAQAKHWLATGTTLVIRDWQVSAAAIQVLYFKRRGGKVCYARSGFNADPALYFHLAESRGRERNSLATFVGAGNAAKIGKLSAHRMKRLHPSAFGIPACPAKLKADKKILARPSLMKW